MFGVMCNSQIILALRVLVIFAVAHPASGQRSATPPIPYQDYGVCPFECCVYREWIATKPTILRSDKRNNASAVFTARKGERVTAITGVVVTTRAGVIRMLKRDTMHGTDIRAGDLLYLLTYTGEGFYKAWYKGRILDFGVWDNSSAKLLSKPQSIWWLKIRNRKGQIGWSNQPDNFDNKDSCAHHSSRPAEQETQSVPEGQLSPIGPKAVWDYGPNGPLWEKIQACQRDNYPEQIECMTSLVQQGGASTEAIAVMRQLKGNGWIDSFKEMGRVDLATVVYPSRANENWQTLLVNGVPSPVRLEDADNLREINIRQDPLYPSLIRKFPRMDLWEGSAQFVTMRRLPAGQRFVFSFFLLNGCHACAVAGHAQIAFDFDPSGVFLGAKLLRLVAEQPTRRRK